ncbi:unnamed protein product, partial [Polarella glacialis]
RLGQRSAQKEFVAFTIPKTKETQEALRQRKMKNDVPGPGVYDMKRYGDDLGAEKTKTMERALRKGTRCWASGQYSHIYQCMKPRSNSMPTLPTAEAVAGKTTKQPAQEPAAQTPTA